MKMKIRNFFLLVMAVATITFASCVNNQSTNNNSDSTMNTRKILVTVDLQKDFINGTLPAKLESINYLTPKAKMMASS
mgnify:CR=1 FL=1